MVASDLLEGVRHLNLIGLYVKHGIKTISSDASDASDAESSRGKNF
jgi:hypothetical protein